MGRREVEMVKNGGRVGEVRRIEVKMVEEGWR